MSKMKKRVKNKSNVESFDAIKCDSNNETKKVYLKTRSSVKNVSKKSELIVISGQKSKVLIKNSQKNSFRKQSFATEMYCKQTDKIRETDSKTIVCQICDQIFENKLILCEHMRLIHNFIEQDQKTVPFPDLIESFSNSKGRIKCGKCCFQTDSEAEMILHSINHSFIAEDCETSSKLRCPTCNRCFSNQILRKHVYIHTSEKPFVCEVCQKEFKCRKSMVLHEKRHLPPNEIFNCQLCSTSFITERGYKNHLKTHGSEREKSYLCEVCGASFFDRESLKAHTIRIHQPKSARRFKCEFGGCRYTTLYHHQLLEHQRTHSDDKPFVCDQCEYTAKSKWSFRKHYRRHTREKPFKCQVCDYSSSLCSNLTRHMRIHTGSKPFKCPYCSYSCNNHENLRKHVLKSKKHQGLNLYNCKHCMYSTNVFTELRQHLELNHNDIYSVEQIDRMISSFYHKSEDNTTVITQKESSTEDSNPKAYRKPSKSNENSELLQESNETIITNGSQSVVLDN